MNLDSPSEDELSSSVPHSLFNEHYEQDIQELFAKFQILETSIKHYQSVPLSRKQERLKQSFTLFRAYWQNALKMLLPYVDEKSLTSQRLFMRYGLVHLSDISEQDLQTLELTTVQTKSSSLLLYMDEWFHNVMEGKIEPLQQDAATPINSASNNNKEAFHLQAIRDSTALETLTEKLCVESKSVATPFLHKNDLNQPLALQIASREIVEKMLHLIKDLDPQIFTRKLLKETVDLEPYIILIPSYSKWGTCWEAFDRFKRTTSRGRIVVPLYATDTKHAVLVALANYRWETAKLAAGGYWLEKGLTGGFYDLYRKHSLPGANEQQAFIQVYCQWILEESRGQIIFHPELREFFWREIPFQKSRQQMLSKYFAQFQGMK